MSVSIGRGAMNKTLHAVVSYALWLCAGVSAIGISVCALSGGASKLSPLGIATIFSASCLCLIIIRASPKSVPAPATAGTHAWLLLALLCVGIIFALNLSSPFLSDDYVMVRCPAPSFARLVNDFRIPGSEGSFRPLGRLYFSATGQWAGYNPLKWHLLSLSFHLLNCALFYLVIWLLWQDRFVGITTALVFGLHGTRPEAVSWASASFDLLAALFLFASFAIFFCPLRRTVSWPLALVLAAAAILCKESAYAYPVLLIGLAYAAGRLSRSTLQYSALAIGLCGGLFAYRWYLFGGPGGYINAATGRPMILSLGLVSTTKALLSRIWIILMFPVNWDAPMWVITRIAIPIGCLIFIGLIVNAKSASRRTLLVLLGTVALSVVPAIHLAAIGKSELGSRILYLPAAGFAVLIAHLVRPTQYRVAVLLAFLFFTVIVTCHNLAAWRDAARLADRLCTAAATSEAPVPQPASTHNGVFFFQNGFAECVAMKREMRQ